MTWMLLCRPMVKTRGGKGQKYNVFSISMGLQCCFFSGRNLFYSSLNVQKALEVAHDGSSIFAK